MSTTHREAAPTCPYCCAPMAWQDDWYHFSTGQIINAGHWWCNNVECRESAAHDHRDNVDDDRMDEQDDD